MHDSERFAVVLLGCTNLLRRIVEPHIRNYKSESLRDNL